MKKIIIASLLLSVSFGYALNLKERKAFESWKAYLTDDIKSNSKKFKDACGYALNIDLDEKTVIPFMAYNADSASYCDQVRGEMANMCSDATNKASIAKNVKKMSCVLGAKGEASFALKGGVLTFKVAPGSGNIEEKAKKYLEENLN